MPHPAAGPLVNIIRATAILLPLLLSACGTPEEKAQDHYRRGTDLLAKNDVARARIEFRNAVQLKDDFVPAWRAIASLEQKQQNWPTADAALRRVSTLDPKDVDARLQLSTISLFSGHFREALEWVDAANAIDQNNARTHALRAAALFKIGDEAVALQEARRSLELTPGNKEAVTVLAAERFAHDDNDAALRVLDTITDDAKSDLGVDLFKIKIYQKIGNVDQVEQRLRNLVARYPKDQVLSSQLLQFYLAHNRQDKVEEFLRQAADADRANSAAGLAVVGFLKETRGEAAARDELLERMKQATDPFDYQMVLAELDIASGHGDTAEEKLKALAADSKLTADHVAAAELRLAQLYVVTRRFALADPLITNVLRSDPGNGQARRLRANALLEQGQLDEAIGRLREALNDQPRATDLMLLLAVAYERSGSIELAAKQFSNAARDANFAPRPGLDYVAFLLRRGRGDEAQDVLNELSSRNPDNIEVLAALAQRRLDRQNWAGAREVAETIRRIGTRPGLADQILGAVSDGQKNYQDSVASLTKAYEANPGEVQSMFALVRSYVLAKQSDKADAFLDSVLHKNPANAEARVLKGLLQMSNNLPDDAAASFKAAIEANPKNLTGYKALADLRIKQKGYDDAINVLKAGLRQEASSSPLLLAYAEVQELNGDTGAAIATYEGMLKTEPGSLIIINNLASLLADRGDQPSLDRAAALAKILDRSETPQFKDTVGWIRSLRGDYDTAIPLLEDAAAALPNNGAVRYHLATTYMKAGRPAKANAEFRKAATLIGDENKDLSAKVRAALKE